MTDEEVEAERRKMFKAMKENPLPRADIEARFGQTWNHDEFVRDFDAQGFAAPLVVVTRKKDGKLGTLFFQPHPRVYFSFEEHGEEAGS